MQAAATRYPNLFSPIGLGPVTLKNRAVIPGHSMMHGEPGPGVSPRCHAYLLARARGGAALVGMESTPAMTETVQNPLVSTVDTDAAIPSLARLADDIHAAGAKTSLLMWHGGRHVPYRRGYVPLAPSRIPSELTGDVPKPATHDDIRHIVAGYAAAARRCRAAGIDVIEVQTAADYLLGSFLSPTLNRREDAYGGSIENRARIVCEILEAVREAAGPGVAVGVRTSIDHHIPSDPDGYGPADSLAAMQVVDRRGLIDYLSVMTGSHYAIHQTIPPMHVPRKQIAAQAAAYRQALSVPIIVAGRIRTAAEAEAIVAAREADLIAMARPWIAEPDWLNKVAEGREDEIRPCISCSQGCIGHVIRYLPGTCVLNPVAGREAEFGALTQAAVPLTVAIVGGGPAGMEAARVAALRGHRVTLYEAGGALGGQMRLAANAPYRGEMQLALAWWERELARLRVSVRLGARIAPDDALDADRVIWAVGAVPAQTSVWRRRPALVDGIPGTRGLPHGRAVMAGEARASGHVLVIDEEANWPPLSLAEHLAAQDSVRRVTVVTAESALGRPETDVTLETTEVTARLAAAGIEVFGECQVARVADGDAYLADGRVLGPFDSIVLSTGTEPAPVPERALAIGDCVAPRGIWAATFEAAKLVRSI